MLIFDMPRRVYLNVVSFHRNPQVELIYPHICIMTAHPSTYVSVRQIIYLMHQQLMATHYSSVANHSRFFQIQSFQANWQ